MPTKFPLDRTGKQQLYTSKKAQQQLETWLVILFLSWKKFHAKQMFVLSSSMKLGPHSADQKHQSLSLVLLTAKQKHATIREFLFYPPCSLHMQVHN